MATADLESSYSGLEQALNTLTRKSQTSYHDLHTAVNLEDVALGLASWRLEVDDKMDGEVSLNDLPDPQCRSLIHGSIREAHTTLGLLEEQLRKQRSAETESQISGAMGHLTETIARLDELVDIVHVAPQVSPLLSSESTPLLPSAELSMNITDSVKEPLANSSISVQHHAEHDTSSEFTGVVTSHYSDPQTARQSGQLINITLSETGTINTVSPNSLDLGRRPREESMTFSKAKLDDSFDFRNLLTFDGGGVRGYWSLLVLEKLMEFIARYEESDKPKGKDDDRTRAYHSFSPVAYPAHVSFLQLDPEEEKEKESAEYPQYLKQAKRFLPCHYFDYIGGSSTGALIAIMLGRLRMTVLDCKVEYRRLCSEVFGHPRLWATLNMTLSKRPKYSASRLEEVFGDITQRRRERAKHKKDYPISLAWEPPSREHLCKTFVTTLATVEPDGKGVTEPRLLRSYDAIESAPSTPAAGRTPGTHQDAMSSYDDGSSHKPLPAQTVPLISPGKADQMLIPLVARAATAAFAYFEPVTLELEGGRRITFEDGSFGTTNNPTTIGIDEIKALHGINRVGAIVSIGTARSNKAKRQGANAHMGLTQYLRRAAEMADSPETVHKVLRKTYSAQQYYRLNPESDKDLLNIQLDEWKPRKSSQRRKLFQHETEGIIAGCETIEEMENAFKTYFADPEVRATLEMCARELVGRRRNRARDGPRWQRYALGSTYKCSEQEVDEDCHKVFTLIYEIEGHLKHSHGINDDQVMAIAVRRAETHFRYPSPTQP